MKKIAQLALLLALVLGFSSVSRADLLIEPVVGYNLGFKFDTKFDAPYASANDSAAATGGGAFGGRLGYQNFGFQLGLDYLKSSVSGDDFDTALDTSEWAGFIGYEFPIMFRIYAGYIFSGTGDTKDDQTNDKVELTKESGTKIGVGFTGLPFIDINLEYRQASWSQLSTGGVDFDGEFSYSTIMLGLSAPFTF